MKEKISKVSIAETDCKDPLKWRNKMFGLKAFIGEMRKINSGKRTGVQVAEQTRKMEDLKIIK